MRIERELKGCPCPCEVFRQLLHGVMQDGVVWDRREGFIRGPISDCHPDQRSIVCFECDVTERGAKPAGINHGARVAKIGPELLEGFTLWG